MGIELKELEELDLKPGAGRAVVQVLPGAGLLENQHAEDVNDVGDESLVLVRVLAGQTVQ